MPSSIVELITAKPPSGLGYCCQWVFFYRYGRTALIAARLGVAPRSVRYYRARFRAGEMACEGKDCCMKRALRKD